MSKVMEYIGSNLSVAASTTTYCPLFGSFRGINNGTESVNVLTRRKAGTLSLLYINVITNDRAASTFRTRKSTASANLLASIADSTTGKFEDTVNTDAVAAGDDWHLQIVTGSGGTVFTYKMHGAIFDASVNTSFNCGGGSGSYTDMVEASVTRPGPFYGNGQDIAGGSADSLVGITSRTAGTMSNFNIRVPTNSRTTTTTFVSRVGSADGNMTMSVTAAATGTFEDTTNSDTIAANDLVNWAAKTGTGAEALIMRRAMVVFTTTNNSFFLVAGRGGGVVQTAGLTRYYKVCGDGDADATESNVIGEVNVAFVASLLECNVSANSIVLDSTLTLRKNSAAANQVVTITALTTGVFQDTVNTDSILDTDTLNYEIVTPSVATEITTRNIALLCDSTAAAGATGIMTPRSGYWGDL